MATCSPGNLCSLISLLNTLEPNLISKESFVHKDLYLIKTVATATGNQVSPVVLQLLNTLSRFKMFRDFFYHCYSLAIVCIVLNRLILNKKTFNELLTSKKKLL